MVLINSLGNILDSDSTQLRSELAKSITLRMTSFDHN